MHAFSKEAERKQKWTAFTRIYMHRLACQRNTLPCAPSILKHRVSAEVCLLGHQWIYLEIGSVPPIYTKPKDSLDIDCSRNEGKLANRFFPRNVLWTFLWDPTEKRQYPTFPFPPKKNWFLFGLGRPIRDMLLIFRDDRSTTLSTRMGLFWSPVVFNRDMPSSNKQQIISCKNWYFRDQRKITRKTPPPNKRLSVMTNDLITFCQVRSRFSAEGLTLLCGQPVLAQKDDWKTASS